MYRLFFTQIAVSILGLMYGCSTDRTAVLINDPCAYRNIECVRDVPDFSNFTDTKEKKKAFFNFLHPIVDEVNSIVLQEREEAESILSKEADELSNSEQEWLFEAAQAYAIDFETLEDIYLQKEELLSRIDIIPPSLALAQSANESAWGNSRFAQDANNLFGQWCFRKGCGLVPKRRNASASHEVRKFESVQRSVASYIRNINRHNSYSELRKIRQSLRAKRGRFSGKDLAPGLTSYSERREAYVNEVIAMIRSNKLTAKDEQFWETAN